MQKLYIRNMVCSRCKMIVQQELDKIGAKTRLLSLGEVELDEPLSATQLEQFKNAIAAFDFELIDDRKSRLIGQIKKIIIETVHGNKSPGVNYSTFLSERLNHDYNYLSNLFSSVEGTTIERFIIENKIEKAKELIVYDELSLTEIADMLGYSSTAHLSSQFKKITGLTPSHFRKTGAHKRRPLDQL